MSSVASTRKRQALAGRMRPERFVVIFAACFFLGIGVLLTPPVQSVDALFPLVSKVLTRTHSRLRRKGAHRGGYPAGPCQGICDRDARRLQRGERQDSPLVGRAYVSCPVEDESPGTTGRQPYHSCAQYRALHQPVLHRSIQRQTGLISPIGIFGRALILDTMVVFWLWVNRVSRSYAVASTGR
jgi:hypothetical protein